MVQKSLTTGSIRLLSKQNTVHNQAACHQPRVIHELVTCSAASQCVVPAAACGNGIALPHTLVLCCATTVSAYSESWSWGRVVVVLCQGAGASNPRLHTQASFCWRHLDDGPMPTQLWSLGTLRLCSARAGCRCVAFCTIHVRSFRVFAIKPTKRPLSMPAHCGRALICASTMDLHR